MASQEKLAELYKDLNYPSAKVFRKALLSRGIHARLSDLAEYTRLRGERQILAPPPSYKGHITSPAINARWAADLISYVARPAAFKGKTWRYALVVQDIFSRYIFTRPLERVDQATRAFEDILEEAGTKPIEISHDGGPEFSRAWKTMLNRRGILGNQKKPEDRQALATLDRAIGTLKQALTRRIAAGGTNWASELVAATKGQNATSHSTLGVAPEAVAHNDDIRFSLRLKNAEMTADNQEKAKTRQERLEAMGAFRVYVEQAGPRARGDKPRWSLEVHQVKNFPSLGQVRDTDNQSFMTNLTLPVEGASQVSLPAYATRGSFQIDEKRWKKLARFVERLRAFDGKTLAVAHVAMKQVQGFDEALSKAKITFRRFVEMFPDAVKIEEGRLVVARSLRGPLDEFAD